MDVYIPENQTFNYPVGLIGGSCRRCSLTKQRKAPARYLPTLYRSLIVSVIFREISSKVTMGYRVPSFGVCFVLSEVRLLMKKVTWTTY